MGTNLRKVVDGDFHHMRKKHGEPGVGHCSALAALQQAGMVFGAEKKTFYQQDQPKTKNLQNPPPQTKRPRPIMVKKVKQAQALTAVYTSPALTSSSAGNSQGPVQGLATMCKKKHPRLASSFSFC